jgi:fibronectin type 3 domain-containing protein
VLNLQFDPAAAGSATGQLAIASNSSTGGTVVVNLTGTGTASAYAVDLTWNAPTGSTDPVAGYNVYRAPGGTTTYQLINSSEVTQTTYVDSTVQSGQEYNYMVESVDPSGMESQPSNPTLVTVP